MKVLSRRRVGLIGAGLAVTLGPLVLAAPAGAAGSGSGSPNPSTSQNQFNAVSADSTTDAWAVGQYNANTSAGNALTLTAHWNGTSWSKLASPSPSATNYNQLNGVSARTSSDAWAVGSWLNSTLTGETLILHWNGTKWVKVASPNPSSSGNVLTAVSADAANDAWAVGTWTNGTVGDTLVEHWNGTKWAVVASPSPGTPTNILEAVVALSPTNVWAVGQWFYGSSTIYHTLIEHWNGTAWSIVTSPNPSPNTDRLFGVDAYSASDIWAVGVRCPVAMSTCRYDNQTLIEHWNGTQWSVVKSPNPATSTTANYNDNLSSVTADSATDAWAAGSILDPTTQTSRTFTLHWNGTAWKTVASPSPGASYSALFGISAPHSASPAASVQAVGYYNTTTPNLATLALEWTGTKWVKK